VSEYFDSALTLRRMMGMCVAGAVRAPGLAESAIRYYERIGLLPNADRVGGWRRYDGDAVRLVNAIRLAKRAGFSLDEIRTLFYGFPPDTSPSKRWQQLASQKLEDIDDLIARAETMRSLLREGLACDCVLRQCRGLEDCRLDPSGEPQPVTG
jgi:MerR family redox-sensitive transcriptional activator SoxR